MSVTLNLKPEAALLAQARATGMTLEGYLQRLVEREFSSQDADAGRAESGSGMVWENGLLLYRAGQPLTAAEIDEAIERARDERTQHILGNLV